MIIIRKIHDLSILACLQTSTTYIICHVLSIFYIEVCDFLHLKINLYKCFYTCYFDFVCSRKSFYIFVLPGLFLLLASFFFVCVKDPLSPWVLANTDFLLVSSVFALDCLLHLAFTEWVCPHPPSSLS